MSKPRWTNEQLAAIEAGGCNLLVSAAAGAGKTAVLVERIIKKITDECNPVDVDKLLVVTFTKAAATEMRERIGTAIARELNRNPDSRYLNRQLILLNRASITTLHSFCLDILRQYFYRIDLDPVFRIADDTEAALLRIETMEDIFERYYAAGDPGFLALVDAYGGDRDDHYLQEILLTLYDFAYSTPWPEYWLTNLAGVYRCGEGLPPEASDWAGTILQWLELQFSGCRVKLKRAARMASGPKGPAEYYDNLTEDIELVDRLTQALIVSWSELYTVINSLDFGKLNPCRDKSVDEDVKKKVQKLRDEVKNAINGIKADIFSRPPEELAADLIKVAPHVEMLSQLTIEFAKDYRKTKAAKSLVDFSDLEHFSLQILMDEGSTPEKVIPSTAAYELREFFTEVLVDEYQDINGVQEAVLQLVTGEDSGGPHRFMVGDVKQSIYRFRLAEPALFLEKYRTFPRSEGYVNRGIDLKKNFRSRPEVVNAVNYIFRQIMTERAGEIVYDSKAELVCGAEYPSGIEGINTAEGPCELYILEKNSAGNELDPEAEHELIETMDLDAVQREARLIAGRIRDMVCGGDSGPEFYVFDHKAANYRPVQYRDIVVLLRSTRNMANTFLEEFRLFGVPAYADTGTGYFEATEVETMMSLLKVIDNPRQDIPLASLLRSPIVGLKAEEMASVRLQIQGTDFYEAVVKSAELGETSVDLRLREFLQKLEEWRTVSRQSPLSELIWLLFNETEYYTYVGGMPGGVQRQANLRALHDRARQYETTSFRGLFRFLRFIEKFQNTGSDLGSAVAVGENEDVVRIMSIHKSKGLEFPVVIAAGLGKQFNTADLKKKAVFHRDLGLGLPVVDTNISLTYPTIVQKAIKKRLHMEMLAEEMRILYVALTRAREKLILVGSVKDIPKNAEQWSENVAHDDWSLPDAGLVSAVSFLDWICPAVARHSNGEQLRKLAGSDIKPVGPPAVDLACWEIYISDMNDSLLAIPEEPVENFDLLEVIRHSRLVPVDEKYKTVLNRNLSWQYPFQKIVGKPAKASVTELKRRFEVALNAEEDYSPYRATVLRRPAFLQKSQALSPAERGTAMHLAMQHLELKGNLSGQGIREQLLTMVSDELLTYEQVEAVDVVAIEAFFLSPLGQRVLSAVEVRREVPFTMAIPALNVYPDVKQSEETVMVQGVIDCLIDEGDGYVIIDYKTDWINDEGKDKLVRSYQGQLEFYATAVEKILQRPVKEKYLYMFSVLKVVKV